MSRCRWFRTADVHPNLPRSLAVAHGVWKVRVSSVYGDLHSAQVLFDLSTSHAYSLQRLLLACALREGDAFGQAGRPAR